MNINDSKRYHLEMSHMDGTLFELHSDFLIKLTIIQKAMSSQGFVGSVTERSETEHTPQVEHLSSYYTKEDFLDDVPF